MKKESKVGKRSHQKSKQSSKKLDDLPSTLAKLLEILKVSPTTNYAVKKSGKDKRIVARDLKRLIERGHIERIEKGFYRVIKKIRVITPSHQDSSFFRVHNLSIEILIRKHQHRVVKSHIIRNKQYYNLRDFGNAGQYFNLEVTGMITKDRLFLEFPKNWEISIDKADDIPSIIYDITKQTIMKWESKFKLLLIKAGRSSIRLSNLHIAYFQNGICHEIKRKEIKNIYSFDSEDGKLRWGIDWSLGELPEIELYKPDKAISDAKEVEYWGNSVVSGNYRQIAQEYPLMRENLAILTKIVQDQSNNVQNTLEICHSTVVSLKIFIDLLTPQTINPMTQDNSTPFYIG